MSTDTVAAPRPLYLRLWAGVPRELGFLLPTLPIIIVATTVLWTLFATGLGLLALVVGVFLVVAALFTARGFGIFELLRLRGAGMPRITAPAWDRKSPRPGFWGKVFAPVIDGHYWLYLLHGLVVNFAVGLATWIISFTWVVTALSGVTYWLYGWFLPRGDRDWNFLELVLTPLAPSHVLDVGAYVGDAIFFFVTGSIALATLPFVTRGLTYVHYGIARGMLGAFRSEALQQRVEDLSASRIAAVAAEGTALRRLERDIHDGPQQRLVRMQMDLAAAERKLESDPAAARALIDEATQHARDALEELRALSRGFAPPILLDRGLVAALRSLAVRNPLPTTVVSELPEGLELPSELERNAYFIAAEALTNAAKHSGGTRAELRLRLEAVPDADEKLLLLEAWDDGRGGAAAQPNHGLAGLEERARGMGGVLAITSPDAGPTTITARLPLPSPARNPAG